MSGRRNAGMITNAPSNPGTATWGSTIAAARAIAAATYRPRQAQSAPAMSAASATGMTFPDDIETSPALSARAAHATKNGCLETLDNAYAAAISAAASKIHHSAAAIPKGRKVNG